jgi:hypothetical protein
MTNLGPPSAQRSSAASIRHSRAVVLGIFLSSAAIDLVRILRTLPRSIEGDEWRYVYYATNLLNGFYSPRDRVVLWNGPGYPLFLMPFISAHWLDGARYANAFFHAGAIAYIWAALRPRISVAAALAAVAPLMLYEPIVNHLPLLYTECASFFLLTAWAYHARLAVVSRLHAAVAGCFLGILTLTKVVFGPAVLLFTSIMGVAWLIRRSRWPSSYWQQGALALVICMPYLMYTYDLTGKVLYWSTAAPNNFYWLTSPYSEEWGDWYHNGWVNQNPMLRAHHKGVFDRASGLDENPSLPLMEQIFNSGTPRAGDIFLHEGLRNVREHPAKFCLNWVANVSRLFVDVPVTVRGTPFWNEYSRWHLPLLAWTALVGAIWWRRLPRRLSFPAPLGFLPLLALGVYSLTSAMSRFLVPFVAIWWLGTLCLLFPRSSASGQIAKDHTP